MCSEFVKPYYDFISLFSELEITDVDIKNSEKMDLIISKYDKIEYIFYTFLISQKEYMGTEFYFKAVESTFELFSNCLEQVKKSEGRYFDEAESGLKLCYLFLPFLSGVMKDFYSLYMD
jgi:hypothetical protein